MRYKYPQLRLSAKLIPWIASLQTARKLSMPGKGKPFKSGISGNRSGRPKLPEDIRRAQLLTSQDFIRVGNKLLQMSTVDIQKILDNPTANALEAVVAAVIQKAVKAGDSKALDMLLDRLIGKAPDIMPVDKHSISENPTIIIK